LVPVAKNPGSGSLPITLLANTDLKHLITFNHSYTYITLLANTDLKHLITFHHSYTYITLLANTDLKHSIIHIRT